MRAPRPIGRIRGHQVTEAVLEDGDVSVAVLSLGCITRDWRVPLGGRRLPVVLGHADPLAYAENPGYLGVIAGRVANRIGHARFMLGQQVVRLPANDGPHHLHGGPEGLSRQVWTMETDSTGNAIRLTHHSADGAGGYPGAVDFDVTISLAGHSVTYDMQATPDRETPLNLAQHNYYNLSGDGDLRGHVLRLAARHYTPVDAALIPTGAIAPVAGTALDYTAPRVIGETAHDINMVLDTGRDGPAAELSAPNGVHLRLWTDQPGLQLYTGGNLRAGPAPHPGQTLGPFAGLCLEPQGFPDAVNRPGFPSILCSPDRPYQQVTKVEIAP